MTCILPCAKIKPNWRQRSRGFETGEDVGPSSSLLEGRSQEVLNESSHRSSHHFGQKSNLPRSLSFQYSWEGFLLYVRIIWRHEGWNHALILGNQSCVVLSWVEWNDDFDPAYTAGLHFWAGVAKRLLFVLKNAGGTKFISVWANYFSFIFEITGWVLKPLKKNAGLFFEGPPTLFSFK